jgi:acetolactate decarboxylase
MVRNTMMVLLCVVLWYSATAAEHVLYQVSTINALLQGIYDGPTTVRTLLTHGNFGLGTFNQLDGEMVVLDGVCYQIRADGTVSVMPGTASTPFAAVTTFTRDLTLRLTGPLSLAAVEAAIDKALPSPNRFYAIKITGDFASLRARSVPRQQHPYPPLTTVVQTQPVFAMPHVSGTLVAFRCPPFVAGLNVTGYHLHFLRADRKAGGHVLDGVLTAGTVQIAILPTFQLALPDDPVFNAANLTTGTPAEVQQVEK